MKKRVIAVYALIGLLALGSTTLTSCVDDNESASVTAIREAKAAQLNALAAASNAEAEVNKALAALNQAQAEAATIKNEYDKQKYAAQLEKLQAEYAQAIAEAQKKQQEAEHQMQGELMQHQQNLYSSYVAAQNQVTSLSNDIAEKNVQIAKLEAGLVSAQAVAAEQIVGFRTNIAKYEAQKKTYQDMGENNYEELVKQYEEAQIKYTNQTTEVTAKTNEQTAAQNAFDKAKWAFEGGMSNGVMIEPTLETGKAVKTLKEIELSLPSSENIVLLTYEPQYVDPKDELTTAINVYSLDEAGELRANAYYDTQLNTANATLGTKDDKAAILYGGSFVVWTDANNNQTVDAGETQPASNWSEYKYYEKLYNDAKAAYEAASEADKPALKIAMDKAQATMIDQKAALITDQEEVIADLNEQKAALKEATDAFTGDTYKAYTDAITAVLAKEGKALDDAKAAVDAAKLTQAELEGEQEALAELVGSNGTVINLEEKIATCDKLIAQANEDIKEAELCLTNPNGNETAQTVLDNAKAELEDLNERLTLAQSVADSWYKQLEASLKGETPDEGGSETPAE